MPTAKLKVIALAKSPSGGINELPLAPHHQRTRDAQDNAQYASQSEQTFRRERAEQSPEHQAVINVAAGRPIPHLRERATSSQSPHFVSRVQDVAYLF